LPPKTTREERLTWLARHPGFWEGLPDWPDRPNCPEVREKLQRLREIVVNQGLYSRKSYKLDVEMSLLRLIKEVRLMRRRSKYLP
jgi:hypothetical protein